MKCLIIEFTSQQLVIYTELVRLILQYNYSKFYKALFFITEIV